MLIKWLSGYRAYRMEALERVQIPYFFSFSIVATNPLTRKFNDRSLSNVSWGGMSALCAQCMYCKQNRHSPTARICLLLCYFWCSKWQVFIYTKTGPLESSSGPGIRPSEPARAVVSNLNFEGMWYDTGTCGADIGFTVDWLARLAPHDWHNE